MFEHTVDALLRVWEHEQPCLDRSGSVHAGRRLAVATGRNDLLAQLGAAAEGLARAIERYEAPDWDRVGRRAGQPVTAWQLAAEAIHEACHHLRGCHDELAAVSDHPLDEEEA